MTVPPGFPTFAGASGTAPRPMQDTGRTCPSCHRPLTGWAGPPQPMPHHYQGMPGVGVPCRGVPATPLCGPCTAGVHGPTCTRTPSGVGCGCRVPTCTAAQSTHRNRTPDA